MNHFSNIFFFLLVIVVSCSYKGPTNKDTVIKITNSEYDALRQVIKDRLAKGIRNVNDYYNLYTYSQKNKLDSTITRFEKNTKLKIVIITFDSTMTSPDSVEAVTRIIGTKNRINTTIGISPYFKKMYIWNDSLINNTLFKQHETKGVIEDNFLPAFKQGNFYSGTLKGLEEITTKIEERLTVTF